MYDFRQGVSGIWTDQNMHVVIHHHMRPQVVAGATEVTQHRQNRGPLPFIKERLVEGKPPRDKIDRARDAQVRKVATVQEH